MNMAPFFALISAFCLLCPSTGSIHVHTWRDATCTAPRTCIECGVTDGVACAHTWSDATDTAPRTCTVCHAIDCATCPHTWTDATCTAPRTCTVCHTTAGNPLGHTLSDDQTICTVCGMEVTAPAYGGNQASLRQPGYSHHSHHGSHHGGNHPCR